MKIRKEYIDKLQESNNQEFDHFKIIEGNTHYLNPKFKEKLIDNVTQIEFNSLYPNLMVALSDEGLFDEKWKEDIEKVDWFIKNRKELKRLTPGEYEKGKIHTNSLYLKMKSMHVSNYINLFYTDLIKKYSDKIIYTDVDLMILNFNKQEFLSETQIEEIYDFDFDTSFINYFWIENRKRYLYQNESGEIVTKGFRSNQKKIDLTLYIKSLIRERKLQNLGI